MAIERITGLRSLRTAIQMQEIEDQMQAESAFHAEMAADADLPNGNALYYKYGSQGEHPLWVYKDWVAAVNDGATRSGYWDWVLYRLNE